MTESNRVNLIVDLLYMRYYLFFCLKKIFLEYIG